jgi:hypothetical protein
MLYADLSHKGPGPGRRGYPELCFVFKKTLRKPLKYQSVEISMLYVSGT